MSVRCRSHSRYQGLLDSTASNTVLDDEAVSENTIMSASAQKITFDMESDAMDIRQSSGSPDRYRVLLVDEQAHVLRVLRMNLDRQGYDVETATNSEEALAHLRQGFIDVLIITSDLPDMSARRLCEKIEADCSADGRYSNE